MKKISLIKSFYMSLVSLMVVILPCEAAVTLTSGVYSGEWNYEGQQVLIPAYAQILVKPYRKGGDLNAGRLTIIADVIIVQGSIIAEGAGYGGGGGGAGAHGNWLSGSGGSTGKNASIQGEQGGNASSNKGGEGGAGGGYGGGGGGTGGAWSSSQATVGTGSAGGGNGGRGSDNDPFQGGGGGGGSGNGQAAENGSVVTGGDGTAGGGRGGDGGSDSKRYWDGGGGGGGGAGPFGGDGGFGGTRAHIDGHPGKPGGYLASESNGDSSTDFSVFLGSGGGGGGGGDQGGQIEDSSMPLSKGGSGGVKGGNGIHDELHGGGGGGGGGAAGGGAIILKATTRIEIMGRLDTDGGGKAQLNAGYGAGGGILLAAPTVTITGHISSLGGNMTGMGTTFNGGTLKIFADQVTGAEELRSRVGRLFIDRYSSVQVKDLELVSINVIGTPKQGKHTYVALVIANNGTTAETGIIYGINPKEEGLTHREPEPIRINPSTRITKFVNWTPLREGKITLIGHVREIPGEGNVENNYKTIHVEVDPPDEYPVPEIADVNIVQAVEHVNHWVSGKTTIARVYFRDRSIDNDPNIYIITVGLRAIDRQSGESTPLTTRNFEWKHPAYTDMRKLENTANFYLTEELGASHTKPSGTFIYQATASIGEGPKKREDVNSSREITYEPTKKISILAVPISVIDDTLIPKLYEAPEIDTNWFSMLERSYPISDESIDLWVWVPCFVYIPPNMLVIRDSYLKWITAAAVYPIKLTTGYDYGVGFVASDVGIEEFGWTPQFGVSITKTCVVQAHLTPPPQATVAHEVGHLMGLNLDQEEYIKNPPNGNNIANFHPIDLWNKIELINAYSFMGKNTGENWISPENFDKLFNVLRLQEANPSDNLLMGAAFQNDIQTGLDVLLAITSDDNVPLLHVKPTLIDAPISNIGTLYSCTLLDATGTLLARIFFEPDFTTFDPYPVNLKIPFTEVASSIQIQKGNLVLFERTIGPAYPTVEVLSPNGGYFEDPNIPVQWVSDDADGDLLSHDVYASSDNGITWFPAALGVVSMDSIPMDTSHAPGGNLWRVKVTATDGFHTTEAISATFSTPTKPPIVMIESPEPNTAILEGQEIYFSGSACDPEQGVIDPNTLLWESTLSGSLYTGPSFRATLPAGEHVVYLEAKDNEGKITREFRTITVKRDSDNDRMADDWERQVGLAVGLNESLNDYDNDGLTNSNEYYYKTDPFEADTDNDGYQDGEEANTGTDPLNPNIYPV